MLVATAQEMRELDRITIEEIGIPGIVLMENAGRGVVRVIRRRTGSVSGIPIGVVCGAGNNGGDGFVIARHLHNLRADVRAYLVFDPARLRGDARTSYEILERMGVPLVRSLEGLAKERILVDALLGTGLRDEVRGEARAAIERINAAPRRALRVAVDIPSGLDADTGHPRGVCVRADVTATMGLPKVGLCTAPGYEWVGELHVVDISIPRDLPAREKLKVSLELEADVAALVPSRPRGGHKGTFGHLLVVAGSSGKTGAALLCGEAALRAGAGLVTLAVPPDVQPALEGRVRELMTAAYADAATIARLAKGKRAVALGPGISTDEATRCMVLEIALGLSLPLVLDADGLNAIGPEIGRLRDAKGPRVLTPHPKEAANLLGISTGQVQSDRLSAARSLAERSGAVIALKGARTVIARPDGRAFINSTGNAALATGGTGDVLTGLLGSLLAQGVEPTEAARLAVYVHGRAADQLVAQRKSDRGLLAREIVAQLPRALRF